MNVVLLVACIDAGKCVKCVMVRTCRVSNNRSCDFRQANVKKLVSAAPCKGMNGMGEMIMKIEVTVASVVDATICNA